MRLLILFIFTAGFFNQLHAQTNVTGPGTLSIDNETYTLTQNISVNGTAFSITGDNIILDLNDHVITYNNTSAGSGIDVIGSNNTIKNGSIIQGSDQSGVSPAIMLRGTGHTVEFMSIQVNGVIDAPEQHAAGIELFSSLTNIHHVYIENFGTTNNISYSPIGIYGDHRTTVGFTINDNIIYNSHQGIGLTFLGISAPNPTTTLIYNNLIQHTRTPGTKSPYGIGLGKSRNVEIYNNQIISDNAMSTIIKLMSNTESRLQVVHTQKIITMASEIVIPVVIIASITTRS